MVTTAFESTSSGRILIKKAKNKRTGGLSGPKSAQKGAKTERWVWWVRLDDDRISASWTRLVLMGLNLAPPRRAVAKLIPKCTPAASRRPRRRSNGADKAVNQLQPMGQPHCKQIASPAQSTARVGPNALTGISMDVLDVECTHREQINTKFTAKNGVT
jgi:hypothetical protein